MFNYHVDLDTTIVFRERAFALMFEGSTAIPISNGKWQLALISKDEDVLHTAKRKVTVEGCKLTASKAWPRWFYSGKGHSLVLSTPDGMVAARGKLPKGCWFVQYNRTSLSLDG